MASSSDETSHGNTQTLAASPRYALDHITVLARSLTEGNAYIRDQLGIDMPPGGSHPRMGTHNRLLSLGESCFLELIAIDPEAKRPQRPRWFDLDRFDAPPILATWVLRTDDIEAALAQSPLDSGSATRISRGDLSWLISIADDGTLPFDGAFPTLIEWPSGPHPAANMVDLGCCLRSLSVEHPRAAEIEALVGDKTDRSTISFRSGPARALRAEIDTPSGAKVLS